MTPSQYTVFRNAGSPAWRCDGKMGYDKIKVSEIPFVSREGYLVYYGEKVTYDCKTTKPI